ncbi:hypothetical protein H5410_004826 [Solanum commersonii]|uniref:Uncharacterized protein n=1 Tax=Solanum commersonii TaxID=4109 RepID=A0A9J6A5F4_SOLCO|nr:hypothetical protein H5410_004826 [Solanum commersonii]
MAAQTVNNSFRSEYGKVDPRWETTPLMRARQPSYSHVQVWSIPNQVSFVQTNFNLKTKISIGNNEKSLLESPNIPIFHYTNQIDSKD